MSTQIVPLNRTFSAVEKLTSDTDEMRLPSMMNSRGNKGWDDIEQEFRCVILAEAGAGKSVEMQARAEKAQAQGRTAFFIRIEDISKDFEDAFEVSNEDDFNTWLQSDEEAWFYLDSIDEARLDHPRAFQTAIRHFAKKINGAYTRAHIFISSRPYAWRPSDDAELIKKFLPFEPTKIKEEQHTEDNTHIAEDSGELHVYYLDLLDSEAIRTFAQSRQTPQIDTLLKELERIDLLAIAARPFDLDMIIDSWKAEQRLESRLKLLQNNIKIRLQEINPDRKQYHALSGEKAREGARLLAAATILSGKSSIAVPSITKKQAGIDAEIILQDWEPRYIEDLLAKAIFHDALYGMVRFRHREIQELLAAEWFNELLKRGHSRCDIESLFLREQYGCKVITPRLRPILAWLILFDSEIRDKTLSISPEVVIEGGDAAHLPLSIRQDLLSKIVIRIAEDKSTDSINYEDAIVRLAQPDLANDVLRLIERYRSDDHVMFFLGRLVSKGSMSECVSALLAIAPDTTRRITARIVAAQAVIICGTAEQRNQLWTSLLNSPHALPRRLLAYIVRYLATDTASIRFLLRAIEKLEEPKLFERSELTYELHHFVERLPKPCSADTAAEPLAIMIEGLNANLDREPHKNIYPFKISKKYSWLLSVATHVVTRLVENKSPLALIPASIAILLKDSSDHYDNGKEIRKYRMTLSDQIPAWKELNDRLFWQYIDELKRKVPVFEINIGYIVGYNQYWGFADNRFDDVIRFIKDRPSQEDKLIALLLAFRIYEQTEKPAVSLQALKKAVQGHRTLEEKLHALQYPVKSQEMLEHEQKIEKPKQKNKAEELKQAQQRAERIKHLQANPELIRQPPGLNPDELSKDQLWLMEEIERLTPLYTDFWGGINWRALIPEFGKAIALAYRDAAMAHWRHYYPMLYSEGHNKSDIPDSLIFAMVGLEIESLEYEDFPKHLSSEEVEHALRYIIWGLNDLPSWLERMHQVYPQEVQNAVLKELYWELTHTPSDKQTYYFLQKVRHSAPWLHGTIAPALLSWLSDHDVVHPELLEKTIDILISAGIDNHRLAELAQSKVNSTENHVPIWYALWIDVAAEDAIPQVEQWLGELPAEQASEQAQLFISQLMCTKSSLTRSVKRCEDFYKAKHLKTLYLLMLRYIKKEDDINRSNQGAYSPTLRDNAQDGREMLIQELVTLPGKETFLALQDLADNHPDPNYRPWMARKAYQRATLDADLSPWTAEAIREFHLNLIKTPTNNKELFTLCIHRLIDIKNWLEQGDDSPYKTWQKADSETEVRNLIAGQLKARSLDHYTCAQENELANRQRTDILIQSTHTPSCVPIELKLLEKWTGSELCERLRNQLAGDYLREKEAKYGIMLLVYFGKPAQKTWEINGKRVSVNELEKALQDYWVSIEGHYPGIEDVKVIVIDLTARGKKSEDEFI